MSGPPLAYQDDMVRLYCCDHRELAAHLRETGEMVDALIVDAPYSERTHAGHDGAERYDGSCVEREDAAYGHRSKTRGIDYAPWSAEDVGGFVSAWTPLTVGWSVSITDHNLGGAWHDAYDAHGLCTFAPLPIVEVGSRVRLAGDGPSSWTCWAVVARPRTAAMRSWGTLRGAYLYTGHGDRCVMGGKRTSSMRDLVRDYSRPGDLVCDPCCGAGTTLLAAKLEGRRAIGCDIDPAHVAIAAERLRDLPAADKHGTLALFKDT